MSDNGRHPSSFRDPSGFIFTRDGVVYRQVNTGYRSDYDHLIASGLYDELADAGLVIRHEEVGVVPADEPEAYKVLRPEPLAFVSYPYEWSFSQIKDAALVTLKIQKKALEHDMTLKDSSAYNIQFLRGRPVMIDSLSFKRWENGEPWDGYRQFCQHFLAPLALAAYVDIRLIRLLQTYIDGLPLDLVSALLPRKTYFRFSLFAHIHAHAKMQQRYADKQTPQHVRRISKSRLVGLIQNLEAAVTRLRWQTKQTEWSDYYEDTNYSDRARSHKEQLVNTILDRISPRTVWDLGANTGHFSRLASSKGISTCAFDIDPLAVERNYIRVKNEADRALLPLVIDLTNPSPGLGWHNRERSPLLERGPADMALALALVHHLAIANNVPLEMIAGLMSRLCRYLVIEFIPKDDSQVQRLLSTRKDIFVHYQESEFEQAFSRFFAIRERFEIDDSRRTLYLMELISE